MKENNTIPPGTGHPFSANEGIFASRLLDWYRIHKRPLPWRETTDPYRIWISEIILQQTRVAQGWEYFNRFILRFPTVAALAAAPEDEVMNYWQGLGYYSRARNLHAAAKEIMEKSGGIFPVGYNEVLSLKGIGEYTAAAICSFAYRAPHAVVDGNVYRVLSRIFGISIPIDGNEAKIYFTTLAALLLDKKQPDNYNQAIMDFGAVQCVPQSPDCKKCPFQKECVAFQEKRIAGLPVKKGKSIIKPRYFNYFHIHCDSQTLLHKRTGKDIWQNLYEFPLIETEVPVSREILSGREAYQKLVSGVENVRLIRTVPMPKHQLSHRSIHAVFYELEWSNLPADLPGEYICIPEKQITAYPVSRLMELYLERSREITLF